jgi:hypothetical protein
MKPMSSEKWEDAVHKGLEEVAGGLPPVRIPLPDSRARTSFHFVVPAIYFLRCL